MRVARITIVVCDKCGDQTERFIRAEDGWSCQCPCGGRCEPGRAVRHGRAPGSTIEYNNGQGAVMYTDGCHPSEIPEYKRACPSLKVNAEGLFVTDNSSHTKRMLAEVRAFREARAAKLGT